MTRSDFITGYVLKYKEIPPKAIINELCNINAFDVDYIQLQKQLEVRQKQQELKRQ